MSRKRFEKTPLLSEELGDADLGDERLNRRLGVLADLVAQRPDAGLPKALDDAELEAAYRFFGNDRVTPEAIPAPHLRQTARRAHEHERVLVVHDTTQFEFGGQKKREGLGRLIRPPDNRGESMGRMSRATERSARKGTCSFDSACATSVKLK
jgi:hypothetical protein